MDKVKVYESLGLSAIDVIEHNRFECISDCAPVVEDKFFTAIDAKDIKRLMYIVNVLNKLASADNDREFNQILEGVQ